MTQIPDISTTISAGLRPRIDRYSRFVATAKRLLPLLALGLLVLVAAWPRVEIGFQKLRALPRLDPREAHDLRMLNPHYTGVDRQNRPYVLSADTARQVSADINDLIGLDGPKADLTTGNGSWIELSAFTGTYKPTAQTLDLFGNVALFIDRGDEFHTDSATIDLSRNTAQGGDRVTGQGPFGAVAAEGFRIMDGGETILFTGHTDLTIDPERQHAP